MDNVRLICDICEIEIYNENDNKKIDLKHGGIVLQGSITLTQEGRD